MWDGAGAVCSLKFSDLAGWLAASNGLMSFSGLGPPARSWPVVRPDLSRTGARIRSCAPCLCSAVSCDFKQRAAAHRQILLRRSSFATFSAKSEGGRAPLLLPTAFQPPVEITPPHFGLTHLGGKQQVFQSEDWGPVHNATTLNELVTMVDRMNQSLIDHYRCPDRFVVFDLSGTLSETPGFFHFDPEVTCYGRASFSPLSPSPTGELVDASGYLRTEGSRLALPFDPTEIVDNLRLERYMPSPARDRSFLKELYYFFRPALLTPIRRHIQRIYFRGWNSIPFPQWPVDLTVERLFEKVLTLAVQVNNIDAIPFIWFWPDGADSAAIMTHDVETKSGRDFCHDLMDIDESFGVPSSFQIVPEKRYRIDDAYLGEFRSRGHEIVIHDLNHDGRLFEDRDTFLERLKAIHQYGRDFGALGFRAAMLYRRADWLRDLEFEYDMSMPNIGHLEAQRGGCCTIFPYFIGPILELPVTVTQDYSLFHILNHYSMNIWTSQLSTISDNHGLANIITHPDYLEARRAQSVYRDLLRLLKEREARDRIWLATPRLVNDWWRQRNKMQLVSDGDGWRIVGPGQERARLGFIRVDGGRIVHTQMRPNRI